MFHLPISSVSCKPPSRMDLEHLITWSRFIGPLPKTLPINLEDPGFGGVDIREKENLPEDVRNRFTADIYDVPLAYEDNKCW